MIRWSCTGRDIGVQKSRKVNKYKQYGDEVGKLGGLFTDRLCTFTFTFKSFSRRSYPERRTAAAIGSKLVREIKVSNFSDFCNSFQSQAAEYWNERRPNEVLALGMISEIHL